MDEKEKNDKKEGEGKEKEEKQKKKKKRGTQEVKNGLKTLSGQLVILGHHVFSVRCSKRSSVCVKRCKTDTSRAALIL